ncbi:MAG: sigma-70 family RNA polymerase sigma factor [Planctomycetes bacterium]|nr:sigma-70 family RNA polymerase sigma factor [Planctomycetota bacterium]
MNRADKQTFEKIAFEYVDRLHGTALKLTRNSAEADDLVQETYARAFQHFGQFEQGTNFKAWIFRILVNTYINGYRRKERAPVLVDFTEMEPVFHEASQEVSFLNQPMDSLYERLDEEVKQALEKLPEEYRVVLLLASVEGFSYEEIAKMVGIPIGTVMSRLFRARALMRRNLTDYAKEHGLEEKSQ